MIMHASGAVFLFDPRIKQFDSRIRIITKIVRNLLLGDTRAAEQKNDAGVRRTAADRISAGMNIG